MRNIRASRSQKKWPKILLWSFLTVLFIGIGVGVACFVWYTQQLKPVNSEDKSLISVNIVSGSSPGQISKLLKEEGVIRNSTAFDIYARLNGVQNNLQAGKYRLTPSNSVPEVVEHLTKGNVDTFSVMFFPGSVLVDYRNREKPLKDRQDVESSLLRAGFSDIEIKEAFEASYPEYNTTLFQGRPAGSDLEGYVYGDTYVLSGSSSAKDALKASFDEFWRVIQENDLVARYKAQGLTLYEGITLASIVQKESIGGGADEKEIAQIFFKRYRMEMQLGSDVTYQYAADKNGDPRSPEYESPYNTRKYVGLTPGPIASPGKFALKAVADPAKTDYLYFLSGDDDVTYYSKTYEGHEANIRNHCRKKCLIM